MNTGVRRPCIVLIIVLMLPAMSAITDTGPSELGAGASATGGIVPPAGSADVGEGKDGQPAGNGEAGRSPPLSVTACLVVAGLGLMALAGVNSRKRRRPPQLHDEIRNHNEHNRTSQKARNI